MSRLVLGMVYVLSGALVFFVAQSAQAQHITSFQLEHSGQKPFAAPGFEKESEDEERPEVSLFVNEPYFKKVKFIKIEVALGLTERVDRIAYGIYTDIPPEYDHYGYEIRRYMAGVSNAKLFKKEGYLKEQLKNIKTAEIILEYWRKTLEKEMDEIEATIEKKNVTSSIRTAYRYNRGVAIAFFVECQSWIENNKRILEYLQEIGPKAYHYNNGAMSFSNKSYLKEFSAIFESKQRALREIRGYMPFRMMVY